MRGWFDRMHWRTQAFMEGRYGQDKLGQHTLLLVVAILIAEIFVKGTAGLILWGVGFALILWNAFRMYSKKIDKRYHELEVYEKIIAFPVSIFKLIKNNLKDKQHRYFRCKCGQIIRVPKGKGKIQISCPKCRNSFIKRT